MWAASETMSRFSCHVVDEGERRPAMRSAQGQGPADVEHAPPADPRRDHEAVLEVALALAQHLIVDGEDQRPIAGRLGTLGERAGQAAVAVHEVLEPERPGRPGGQILDRDRRAVAHGVDRAGRAGGARGQQLAPRPEHAGQAGRPDDYRQREPLAEQQID